MTQNSRYQAYLSYSHRDEQFAVRLHAQLETYRVPSLLVQQGKPSRLSNIFRDRAELPSSADLGRELTAAIALSDALIVVCSPAAAASRWVDEEIIEFKKNHPGLPVLPVIVEGEPPECFPRALQYKVDVDGVVTGAPEEPIAADARPDKDGFRDARLKIVAGLLGVGFDELKQREVHRQYRRLGILAGVFAAVALTMSVLLVIALGARNDAERRREQAEGLISFMIVDLRNQLEPLGRLDILAAVGDQAVSFYGALESEDLTDDVLATRARALRQIGEVRAAQGRLDDAQASFRQSLELALVLSKRHPHDDALLFEVGQSHFWLGFVEVSRSRLEAAKSSFESYGMVTNSLLERQPRNFDYGLEAVYVQSNLGSVAFAQRDLSGAAAHFERSVELNERLLDEYPDDVQLRHDLAEGLSWLGAVADRSGNPRSAIGWYDREMQIREQIAESADDMAFRFSLQVTRQLLAAQRFMIGARSDARKLARASLQGARELVVHDPTNSDWQRGRNSAALFLAWTLLGDDNAATAALLDEAVTNTASLWESDRANDTWRADYAYSQLLLARLRLLEGDTEQALPAIRRGLAAAAIDATPNEIMLANRSKGQLQLALGDAERMNGDEDAALEAWGAALDTATAALEGSVRPIDMSTRAIVLNRLGRRDEARKQLAELAAHGYEFVESLVWSGFTD